MAGGEKMMILENLKKFIDEGKIRYIGLSNETPWGTMKFLHHSNISSTPRVQSIQNAYNLLNRIFEFGGSEIAFRENVGLLAYSPLAQGYLTGKYQNGNLPEGSRKALFDRLQRYEGVGSEEAIESYLNYDGTVLHGEAVSIGIIMAYKLSVKIGTLNSFYILSKIGSEASSPTPLFPLRLVLLALSNEVL
mgnify:CR=1 FL=1